MKINLLRNITIESLLSIPEEDLKLLNNYPIQYLIAMQICLQEAHITPSIKNIIQYYKDNFFYIRINKVYFNGPNVSTIVTVDTLEYQTINL